MDYGFQTQTASGLGAVKQAFYEDVTSSQPLNGNARVATALQETGKLAEVLFQELGNLEQRISPVLRPVGPTGANQKDTAPNNQPSPLAISMELINDRLQKALAYIAALQQRVDL